MSTPNLATDTCKNQLNFDPFSSFERVQLELEHSIVNTMLIVNLRKKETDFVYMYF